MEAVFATVMPGRRLDMPSKKLDCPVCGGTMKKRAVEGVEIDYCDWHGVWLDAGELERLMVATGAGQPAHPGMGKAIAKGLAGATVAGAGFCIGGRLVGGLLDAVFKRKP